AGNLGFRNIPNLAFAQLPACRGQPFEVSEFDGIDRTLIGAPGKDGVILVGAKTHFGNNSITRASSARRYGGFENVLASRGGQAVGLQIGLGDEVFGKGSGAQASQAIEQGS